MFKKTKHKLMTMTIALIMAVLLYYYVQYTK
ncbi:hypothetical protein S101395_04263 [Bacillus sonorensis]|uniref:Uncharacterized protein n=1 Tax=Bacillus sonorensis TaxID=119858 RepID=A0ABM6LMX0_9BACI|nr:hypothetical protein S101395_04263 [Bacillus sonorensis]